MNSAVYFEQEKIGVLMRRFAVPCILSLLVSSLYNIVDQIFIGWGVGYLGNGATNVVFPITVMALAIALMIGDGCAAHISLCLGRKDSDAAARSAGSAITVSVILSVVLTVLFFFGRESILSAFGATENTISYAREYFDVIVIGIPAYIFTNAMNSIIRADGSPKFAMISTLIGCIINCILDPIAIFVLNWGVFGAGLATIVGQFVTAILAIWYMTRCKSFHIQKNYLFQNLMNVKEFLPLGFSSFLTQISIVITMGFMNNAMVFYGAQSIYGSDIPLTVFGIVMKVFQIVIAFVIGIAAGSQPIIGYNYGAKRFDRVKEIYRKVVISEIFIGVISLIVFEFFPLQIIGLFGGESELYNQFAVLAFRIYLCTIILCCIQKATSVFLQAVGQTAMSFTLSLLREVVFIILVILIVPRFIGLYGTLLAAPVADVLSIVLVAIMMRKTFKDLSIAS